MADIRFITTPSAEQLQSEIESCLKQGSAPLEMMARNIRGIEQDQIEFLGRTSDGSLAVVRICKANEDAATLVEGLAQCHWISQRLSDWKQLSSQFEMIQQEKVVLYLVAPKFCAHSVRVAQDILSGRVRLLRYQCLANGEGVQLFLEELGSEPETIQQELREIETQSHFRSDLNDDDLGLTAAERASFE